MTAILLTGSAAAQRRCRTIHYTRGMVTVMLMLIAGGIGLTQAVSDPHQVTLRWLRLGGIIAVCLLAVAATTIVLTEADAQALLAGWKAYTAIVLIFALQLLAVQMGLRLGQRVAATAGFVAICLVLWLVGTIPGGAALVTDRLHDPFWDSVRLFVTAPLSAGLLGGFLMTMLLGHAYLTAGGEMTQAPFLRLVWMLILLLLMRTISSSLFGMWSYWGAQQPAGPERLWIQMMIVARYAVGLVGPGVFIFMVYDCVKRRANQSATGILYVASVLIILGEGIGFALRASTGCVF